MTANNAPSASRNTTAASTSTLAILVPLTNYKSLGERLLVMSSDPDGRPPAGCRAAKDMLAPEGSCAFCDDASAAASDVFRFILPPLEASVLSVGKMIAHNNFLASQMEKMRADIDAKEEQMCAAIDAKNAEAEDLEDINHAAVAENKELIYRLEASQEEVRGLKRHFDMQSASIGNLLRSELELYKENQSLLKEVKSLKSEVHDLAFEVHTLRTGPMPPEEDPPMPPEEDPPVKSTGSSQGFLNQWEHCASTEQEPSEREFLHQL